MLANEIIAQIPNAEVTLRDAGKLPLLTPASTADLTAAPQDRRSEARADLDLSDQLIAELVAADVVGGERTNAP